MFRTKLDLELRKQIKSGSPFFNLRDSIFIILKSCNDKPEEPIMYYIDERGIVEEPPVVAESLTRKKGFVVVVQQLYKWKYLPVAKVLFCDCQRFADMLRNKPENTQMKLMQSFWSVTWLRNLHAFTADQQEQRLIRKMLYANAARVPQESGSDVWKNSFITLMFPREAPFDFGALIRSVSLGTSQSEEDISPGSVPEFLADLLQHRRGPFDKGLDHESFFDLPRWEAPLREPECVLCHSKTAALQRCSGCKRVFYCSKICQRKHWKEHKPECQKFRL